MNEFSIALNPAQLQEFGADRGYQVTVGPGLGTTLDAVFTRNRAVGLYHAPVRSPTPRNWPTSRPGSGTPGR